MASKKTKWVVYDTQRERTVCKKDSQRDAQKIADGLNVGARYQVIAEHHVATVRLRGHL